MMSEEKTGGATQSPEVGEDKAPRLKKQNSKKDKKRRGEESKEASKPEPIVGRVLGEDELGHFVDLGLGRGVDATKASPWLSKSSFQVREVTFDNVIGTEEGGLVNHFEELVESVQQLQTNMSASVPASQQVSVGVDSELSRSYTKTKRSVGTKVHTRTISFRADFDDICVRKRRGKAGRGRMAPRRAITLPEGEEAKAEAEATLLQHQHQHDDDEDHKPTFEERLTNWILEHLNQANLRALHNLVDEGIVAEDANPVDKMNALIDSGKVTRKDLRPLCHDFVSATCITHYVCAIQLGAAAYKVMTDEEVQTELKTKGKIGVSSAADVSVSQKAKWSRRNKQKHGTKIGVMEGGKVERGTSGEAVVGVKFQPLSSVVVRCNMLKKALEAALQRYIDSQGSAKYGPFYISCHSEQLFFKVSDDNKVVVTDDVNDASEFFIVPCEEDAKSRHFSIFYNSESKLKQPKETRPRMRIKPIPRYLCTSVNFRGISNNPLDLKLNAKESKSMLVLQDRRSKHLHPVDLTDWINGKEIYYINCKHRSFKKDSYICVTADRHSGSTTQMDDVDGEGEVSNGASQNETSRAAAVADSGRSGDRHRYSTCCKSSVSAHDDHSNFMLFRLIRVKQKDDDWERYEDHEAIDSDAQGDRRASVDGHKGGRGGGGGGRRNKMAKSQSITEANPDE